MTEKKNIGVHFGALVPSLKKQLEKQGIILPPKGKLAHLQKDTDAITRLYIRGLLPESAVKAARNKLLKKIVKTVEEGIIK